MPFLNLILHFTFYYTYCNRSSSRRIMCFRARGFEISTRTDRGSRNGVEVWSRDV